MSRFVFNGGGDIPVPGNDTYTKVLLHFNGSNGSTSFIDSNVGGVSRIWTPTNATISSLARKFGSASGLFASGYIQTPVTADLQTGSNDFTVDFWVNRNGQTGASDLAGKDGNVGNNFGRWAITFNASNFIQATMTTDSSGNSLVLAGSNAVTNSIFRHIALVRSGTSYALYLDGATAATGSSSASYPTAVTGLLGVASFGGTQFNPFAGYIDEFRYSVGIARWTSNFTPPTGPYN